MNAAAAWLTHAVFLLAILLTFVKCGEPQATVKQEPARAALPEAPRDSALLPGPAPQLRDEDGPSLPHGEAEPADSDAAAGEPFDVAQRSGRSRRQQRQEPPPEPVTPLPTPPRSPAEQARADRLMSRLVAAYPDFLAGHDENNLIWRDGTRMGFDDGQEKTFEQRLANPDVEDQFAIPYPAGDMLSDPEPDFDPGRIRNTAFFTKMYGDCRRGEVQKRLVDVVWLPKNGGRKIKVTPVNGVAEKLQRISDELDNLPPELLRFVRPIPATYNCRDTGTPGRFAAHGFGIAIDLPAAAGDYWEAGRGRRGQARPYEYRNRIPYDIAAVFEKHGFIWGAKWYHYDTAHFEYRPEMLVPDEAGGEVGLVPMPVKQPRNLD